MKENKNIEMSTWIKIIYYTTLILSMLVGLWHFFVPNLYNWYD